jgi:hypothetical protein
VKAKTWPFATASAAACATGIAIAAAVGGPALYGAVAASLGAVCALAALVAVIDRGTNGVLLGFTIGFLVRGVLVGAGLIASGARGNAALAYVIAFFALYAVTQTVEVLFVHAHSRRVTT